MSMSIHFVTIIPKLVSHLLMVLCMLTQMQVDSVRTRPRDPPVFILWRYTANLVISMLIGGNKITCKIGLSRWIATSPLI